MTDHIGKISIPSGLTLITGGARSGKSSLALRIGQNWGQQVHFIATASAGDDDMARRIENHKSERPDDWETTEAPLEVASAVAEVPPNSLLILDCLTMWTANMLLSGAEMGRIEDEALRLSSEIVERESPSIVVTNEVGLGIVPDNELSRQYRDLLGRVNQSVAHNAAQTLFACSGKVLRLENIEDVL